MPTSGQATKDVRPLLLSQSTRGLAHSGPIQMPAQGILAARPNSCYALGGAYHCGLLTSVWLGGSLRITINEETDERSAWAAMC